MNTYEFVTPSDPITFQTDSDKIAFACALLLGNGKAGCHRIDENGNEVAIPSMLMFSKEPEKKMDAYVGTDFGYFVKSKKGRIKECFQSFSYGHIEDRKTYDDAINAITDPEKLKEFKAKHEDRNRTSMSQWVKRAWEMGERM